MSMHDGKSRLASVSGSKTAENRIWGMNARVSGCQSDAETGEEFI